MSIQVNPGSAGYTRDDHDRYVEFEIRFWYQAGYDFINIEPYIPWAIRETGIADTAALTSGERKWQDESTGAIMSWADFERYPWPKPEDVDYFQCGVGQPAFTRRHAVDLLYCEGPDGEP